jgi:AcrR family transcriptional regulator
MSEAETKATPPTQERARDRQRRILDAALSVFSRRGYRDASVDEIAAEADTSKGGVYFHFPGKQAIFFALMDRAARQLLRPGMVLGRSTHSVAQAREAQAEGADYIAVGSMFPTQTKPDFQLVGPELIRAVRPVTKAPLVGIGGITRDNVAQVIRAGADGVAVISAVCGAPDPAAATREFLAAIRAERDLTRRGSL